MIHNDNIIIGDVNNKDIVKIDNLKAEGNVPCEEQHEKMKKGLKGILTDHITGKQIKTQPIEEIQQCQSK